MVPRVNLGVALSDIACLKQQDVQNSVFNEQSVELQQHVKLLRKGFSVDTEADSCSVILENRLQQAYSAKRRSKSPVQTTPVPSSEQSEELKIALSEVLRLQRIVEDMVPQNVVEKLQIQVREMHLSFSCDVERLKEHIKLIGVPELSILEQVPASLPDDPVFRAAKTGSTGIQKEESGKESEHKSVTLTYSYRIQTVPT